MDPKNFARLLRRKQTDAEARVWYRLRDRRLEGFKFRRQYRIGAYVVDFACLARRLVVELDGSQHASRERYDAERSAYLASRGFHVLRFWNNQVTQDTEAVLEVIRERLRAPSPRPSPPQGGGEGD